MFKAVALATVFVASLSAFPSYALAQPRVNIGNLACTVDGGIGLILGSRRNVTCRFTPTGSKRVYTYRGEVSRLGLDIGVTNRSFIRWLVIAPGAVKPGALAGRYAGASAQVSAGLGLGANVIVGGLRDSVALQPLSVQGQTGLNIAAGISSLRLRFVR